MSNFYHETLCMTLLATPESSKMFDIYKSCVPSIAIIMDISFNA